jgi:ribosomal protein S18 acetylase RimI-like enzyme
MHVRLATGDDAAVIASHNVALAKESEGYSLDQETALEGVTMLLQQAEKGFYMVAEDGDVLIGQVMITFEWSDWRARDIWWLQSIYVKPQWRRKGVMRALISAVSRLAAKQHVPELRLYVHMDNDAAIQAYRHIQMQKLTYFVFALSVDHHHQ